MAHSYAADVLVVGAGPVGLTAAGELRRRGVGCRIVDRLPARLPFAKAVGVQPRTLEIWDRMGLVRTALEAAVPMRGQLMYVNGVEQPRIDLFLPPDVPYGFAALPQYETERILEEFLAGFGTGIERGTELVSFSQDDNGVTSLLRSPEGVVEEVRSRYLVGCDGAHSIVRKGLGLTFEGGAFPDEYMLADVEVNWDLPHEYGVRALHKDAAGTLDDILVCIPLPGRGRYRMSMLVPPGLSLAGQPEAAPTPPGDAPGTSGDAPGTLGDAPGTPGGAPGGADGVAHGLETGRAPALPDVQAVLDRLSPRPTTASGIRWASVFRISHRLVDRYGDGRVFVAGDAAHIHPPTGAQGMNTGIQDAWNLAWKLALAVDGAAHPALLASYDAERRPVGEEVVGRTVRHARQGIEADPADPATLMLREAQLLVGYRGGPLVGPVGDGPGPQPGDRAPDCAGLTGPIAAYPMRLYDLLRARDHVLLLYGDGPGGHGDDPEDAGDGSADNSSADNGFDALAAAARDASAGRVEACAILAAGVPDGVTRLPVYHDGAGEFARGYAPTGPTAFVVRPDGYLGARLSAPTPQRLAAHLATVFGTAP
ncbi:FAD-dependent monooxygenase [Streptomyces sp. NPDC058662]|uniref:FAD-dependent monooxygenase n=1 Tax=Streptomyces sp. NPDC058662 TaxID=3346583 RepID=UPI00365A71F5